MQWINKIITNLTDLGCILLKFYWICLFSVLSLIIHSYFQRQWSVISLKCSNVPMFNRFVMSIKFNMTFANNQAHISYWKYVSVLAIGGKKRKKLMIRCKKRCHKLASKIKYLPSMQEWQWYDVASEWAVRFQRGLLTSGLINNSLHKRLYSMTVRENSNLQSNTQTN